VLTRQNILLGLAASPLPGIFPDSEAPIALGHALPGLCALVGRRVDKGVTNIRKVKRAHTGAAGLSRNPAAWSPLLPSARITGCLTAAQAGLVRVRCGEDGERLRRENGCSHVSPASGPGGPASGSSLRVRSTASCSGPNHGRGGQDHRHRLRVHRAGIGIRALQLQRPLPDGAIVARGEKMDGAPELAVEGGGFPPKPIKGGDAS
jgi:hypothetical protein